MLVRPSRPSAHLMNRMAQKKRAFSDEDSDESSKVSKQTHDLEQNGNAGNNSNDDDDDDDDDEFAAQLEKICL